MGANVDKLPFHPGMNKREQKGAKGKKGSRVSRDIKILSLQPNIPFRYLTVMKLYYGIMELYYALLCFKKFFVSCR